MDEPENMRKTRLDAMMVEMVASKSSLERKRATTLAPADDVRFQKMVVAMAGFKWPWGPKEDVSLKMVNELIFDWRKRIGDFKFWKDEPVNDYQGWAYLQMCPPDVDENHQEFIEFMSTHTRLAAHDRMQEMIKIRPSRSQWILMDSLVQALGDLVTREDVEAKYQKAYRTSKGRLLTYDNGPNANLQGLWSACSQPGRSSR